MIMKAFHILKIKLLSMLSRVTEIKENKIPSRIYRDEIYSKMKNEWA